MQDPWTHSGSPRSLDQGPGSSGGPRAHLLDDWMAGLAGGGISFYYAILCIEYVQNMYRIYIYIYIYYGIWYMVYGYTGIRIYGYTDIRVYGYTVYGYTVYGNLHIFAKNKSAQNCPA